MKSCEITPTSNCHMYNKAIISPDEIYNKYLNQGFKYFKLEGRTFSETKILLNLIKYMIKPEYTFMVIKYTLQK